MTLLIGTSTFPLERLLMSTTKSNLLGKLADEYCPIVWNQTECDGVIL
jgi:hypothetical protein